MSTDNQRNLSALGFRMLDEITAFERKHRRYMTRDDLLFWKGQTVSSMLYRGYLREQTNKQTGQKEYPLTAEGTADRLRYMQAEILRSSGPRQAFTENMEKLALRSRRYRGLSEERRRAMPSSRTVEANVA